MKNLIFNTQICTTIEQSKGLLELGLKKETADMMHVARIKDYEGHYIPEDERHYDLCLFVQEQFQNVGFCEYDYIPAWSLHRLIAMLPDRNRDWLTDYCDFKDCSKIYNEVISLIEWMIENGVLYKEYLKKE